MININVYCIFKSNAINDELLTGRAGPGRATTIRMEHLVPYIVGLREFFESAT